ncbi:serine/threonine-protein kinase [Microbispora sp. H10949]|uniref:serine/threonine protein kinase n=1 Tax=Microbispora sp. H10949 TaxID=2729111 RepID=UPI002873D4E8|nr:serine/threonine-protein kinase [Microbispora sp. H10949]
MGPYRIVGRLGAGGMGIVYAGVDHVGQRAAVKLIHEMHAADQEFRIRFRREIATLRRVQGACCVRILAADPDAAKPWLATEYISGLTLGDHVGVHGPLRGDELFGLAAGLAEALVAVHAVGVVHRDLKPSNVMLSPTGPRLVDFGIARTMDATSLTRTGLVIGSPGWVSPEDYAGGRVGPASDVYGWALVVLYAATGAHPYGTGRPEVLALKVMNEEVDTGSLPGGLRPLVDIALAKSPAARPTINDVLAEVARIWRDRHGEGTTKIWSPAADITALLDSTWTFRLDEAPNWPSELPHPQRRQLRRYLTAAASVAVIASVGALLLTLLPERTTQQHPLSAAVTVAPSNQASSNGSATPSSTPNVSVVATSPAAPLPVPETAVELAAALDLALSVTPAARFSFDGGFTQSSAFAKATGRVLSRGARYYDDFEMDVHPSEDTAGHYVILGNGDLYLNKSRAKALLLEEQSPADASWYALMVAGTAGPSVIHEVVANSTQMHRKGRTYSGVLPGKETSGRLRMLLSSWLGGDLDETGSSSYLAYTLTIDADNRPKRFKLIWKIPVGDRGTYESEFTTTYQSWTESVEISKPVGE